MQSTSQDSTQDEASSGFELEVLLRDRYAALPQDTKPIENPDLSQKIREKSGFEFYAATLVDPSEAGDIDQTIRTAQRRLPEDTLALIAVTMAEARETDKVTLPKDITASITQIAMLLEEMPEGFDYTLIDNRQEPIPVLLRLRTVQLIRAVGYARPEEAFEDVLARHGLEFLVQAAMYLNDIYQDHIHNEFRRPLHLNLSFVVQEPLAIRVGKLLRGRSFAMV